MHDLFNPQKTYPVQHFMNGYAYCKDKEFPVRMNNGRIFFGFLKVNAKKDGNTSPDKNRRKMETEPASFPQHRLHLNPYAVIIGDGPDDG